MSTDLDALLIENLGDLEGAMERLGEVQSEVFKTLDEVIENWCQDRDWRGVFDYLEDELWVAPARWLRPGSEAEFEAWFTLDVGAGDHEDERAGEDRFYLTRIVGAGAGMLRFRLGHDFTAARGKALIRTKAAELQALGFSIDGKGIAFTPVYVPQDALAKAVRDGDAEEALIGALTAVLGRLEAAAPLVDALIAAAKVKY